MRLHHHLSGLLLFLALAGIAHAVDKADITSKTLTVDQAYRGLASGALTFATLGDLPEGQILKSANIQITQKDLDGKLQKAPNEIKPLIQKNKFYFLEQYATDRLLIELVTAKTKSADNITSAAERSAVGEYLQAVAEKVVVTDKEIAEFYQQNKEMMSGAPLATVKNDIREYLLGQKREEAVKAHVRSLGKQMPITVSASWTKQQAALAMDNAVDKARKSGVPSLIEFGSEGCGPCRMMAPILETLKKKYAGKANVLVIKVDDEQILGARYNVEAIPVQAFYDKEGNEIFRHVGFFPQAEIEKKLAEMGVK